MPSFIRYRTPSPTYAIPIHSNSPSKTVDFIPGPPLFTSFSRDLTNDELWALYYFESHARLCNSCRDPYRVHRSHGSLCEEGHRRARKVASFVRSTSNGRKAFDARMTGGNAIRLEIPQDYSEVSSLLHAMERSLRHPRQRPIVSFELSPNSIPLPVPTRTTLPERRYSVKESSAKETSSPLRTRSFTRTSPPRTRTAREPETSPQRYERREPQIVDWPEIEYEIREPSLVIQPSQQPKTKLPEREPKQPADIHSSSSPKKAPSRRNSYQAAPSAWKPRAEAVSAPLSQTRQRSSTLSSYEKQERRRSMFGGYDVEVREPKSRQKRNSTFLF